MNDLCGGQKVVVTAASTTNGSESDIGAALDNWICISLPS